MYIFYGLELPKSWKLWPSAFGDKPLAIEAGRWQIDVPNIGGEPVLKDGKAVTVQGYELTLYRYPHDQEEIHGQENLGVLGFLVCEIEAYTNPTDSLKKYQEWHAKFSTITNFDIMLSDVCKILEFNSVKAELVTCESSCSCC